MDFCHFFGWVFWYPSTSLTVENQVFQKFHIPQVSGCWKWVSIMFFFSISLGSWIMVDKLREAVSVLFLCIKIRLLQLLTRRVLWTTPNSPLACSVDKDGIFICVWSFPVKGRLYVGLKYCREAQEAQEDGRVGRCSYVMFYVFSLQVSRQQAAGRHQWKLADYLDTRGVNITGYQGNLRNSQQWYFDTLVFTLYHMAFTTFIILIIFIVDLELEFV